MNPRHLTLLQRCALVLVVAVMVACSWLGPLESTANEQVDAGFKRALVSFASARALNAVISLAQGTEVAIQPVGVGVTLTVGQVLDPVNDLVEQFSNLMLAASVAFGVQKVLLLVGAHWLISLVLTAAALAWAVLLLRGGRSPRWLVRVLLLLLLVRFAIPVVTIGSDAVFQQFLARDYQASQQALQATASQLDTISPAQAPAVEGRGWIDRLRDWGAAQNEALRNRFGQLAQAAEQATEHIVRLIVIFLLQTLVVPALLLWGLLAVGRGVLRPRPAGT